MRFTATPLAHHEYLVEGTDAAGVSDSTVVDGTQWDAVLERQRVQEAHGTFDEKVAEFFAPLMEAIDEINAARAQVDIDPLLYIVEQEAVEGRQAQSQKLLPLDHGAVILRAISTGAFDRLRWVKGELVVTATPAAAPEPVADGPTVPAETQPESNEG